VFAVVLSLCASACLGTADFLGGLKARVLPVAVVLLVAQAVALLIAVPIVAISGADPPSTGQFLAGLAAGLASVVGLVSFYRALAIGTMSIVAPIAATGVIIPVAAGLIDGEQPHALQFAGMALAAAGVVLASREPASEDPDHKRSSRAAIALALLAAAGLGLHFVAVDAAAAGSIEWSLLTPRLSAVPLLVLIVLRLPRAVRMRVRLTRGDAVALLALGTLDAAGIGMFAWASTQGLLSLVAVGSSLYPVVTVILAWSLLHERLGRHQRIGVAGALAGIVLIAAG
jgi:drug/metabolite transporter (DMT)-like permease